MLGFFLANRRRVIGFFALFSPRFFCFVSEVFSQCFFCFVSFFSFFCRFVPCGEVSRRLATEEFECLIGSKEKNFLFF